MGKLARPLVVVSKCIEFEPVRWNAQMISSDLVRKLEPHAKFIPVCPEVEIGLGVPRETLRIVSRNGELRLAQPATGFDFTDKMESFVDRFLVSLDEIDGFIFKSGSPTCAFKDAKVYSNARQLVPISRIPGFFGRAVLAKFPDLAIEDERRLSNFRIREHFLTKLYALASFREAKNSHSMNEVVKFHSNNKLLLTAYSQRELTVLGRVIADQKNRPPEEIVRTYQKHLFKALKHPPPRGSNINVMTKVMGYFSERVSKQEKAFFLASVEKYKAGRLPSSAVRDVLKAWTVRFGEDYLMEQTFLKPYLEELMDTEATAGHRGEKNY